MFRFNAKRTDNNEIIEGYYYQRGEKGYIMPVYGNASVSDESDAIEVDPTSVKMISAFTTPDEKEVGKLTKKHIYGVIYSTQMNVKHHDDFVRYTLELSMLTL